MKQKFAAYSLRERFKNCVVIKLRYYIYVNRFYFFTSSSERSVVNCRIFDCFSSFENIFLKTFVSLFNHSRTFLFVKCSVHEVFSTLRYNHISNAFNFSFGWFSECEILPCTVVLWKPAWRLLIFVFKFRSWLWEDFSSEQM